MAAGPLLEFSDVWHELAGFVAQFMAVGAAGFWLTSRRAAAGEVRDDAERGLLARASIGASTIGLAGALGSAGLLYLNLAERAAGKHVALVEFVRSQPPMEIAVAFSVAAVVGFALARARVGLGWWLAMIVLLSPFRALLTGTPLQRLVNPVHRFAGALWIGTLFVMVRTGLQPVLKSSLSEERRAKLAKVMVDAFSPLALGGFAVLGVMGVITAWTNLKKLDALWTTPFGFALIVKLVIVAGVVALGAINWKKQKPKLGTFEGAQMLRRSAELELWFATAVLIVTSILVSLPGPGE